jgi:hypothetical protein
MFQHLLLIVVAVALPLASCKNDENSPRSQDKATPSATQPTTFTGTLRGGMMAIGGETTGWTLVGDAQTGGIQVDVSRIKDQAQKLDGKRVTITGKMTEKNYVESGRTPILVADKIEPAPEPAPR